VWAPLGLRVTPPGGGAPGPGKAAFQALIYLNGWLIGRYINNLGPQDTFYLPQGLLRTDGQNTLAIAEWSLADGAGGLGQPRLLTGTRRYLAGRRDSFATCSLALH
jgi:Beta-galactosidase jelly roll domain